MAIREDLEREFVRIPGLTRQRSRFGDSYSYFVGDREIAHFHGDGRLDLRLTRQRIREMKSEGLLDPRVRTRGPSADWVALPIGDHRDLTLALELLEEAIRSNG